jgi:ABC-2 type transport system ATP-binding protein
MIKVKNLTKWYGKNKALDDVSFEVSTGEVLGFLGPNGAGKSTTMNIITGYLSSTKGTVEVDGAEILDNPKAVKKNIGYLPEVPPLYPEMTVIAYLEFMFDLKKVTVNKVEHIEEICELVKISDVKDRLIKNLSKGYRQRVGLAQALLGYPPVLILDEPTVGLDPKQIIEIRNLIESLAKKHTIILSSHVLPEVQSICDKILVINKGKIVAFDTSENLANSLNKNAKLTVRIEGDGNKIFNMLKDLDGVIKIDKKSNDNNIYEYEVEYNKDLDIRRPLTKKISDIDAVILSISDVNMSLEAIFLELTEEDSSKQQESVKENKENTPKDIKDEKGGDKK